MSRVYLPGRLRRPSMAPLMLARPAGKTDAAGRSILLPWFPTYPGDREQVARAAARRRGRAARASRKANRR